MNVRWLQREAFYLLSLAVILFLVEVRGDEPYEVSTNDNYDGLHPFATYPLFFSIGNREDSDDTDEPENTGVYANAKRDLIKGPSFLPIIDGTEPDIADEYQNPASPEDRVRAEAKELIPKRVKTVTGSRMSMIGARDAGILHAIGNADAGQTQVTAETDNVDKIEKNPIDTASTIVQQSDVKLLPETNGRNLNGEDTKNKEILSTVPENGVERSKTFAYKERQALSEDLIKLLFNWERHKIESKDEESGSGAGEDTGPTSELKGPSRMKTVESPLTDKETLNLLPDEEVGQVKPASDTAAYSKSEEKTENAVSREFRKAKGKINVLVNVNINERPIARSVLGRRANSTPKEEEAVDTNAQARSYLGKRCNTQNTQPCATSCRDVQCKAPSGHILVTKNAVNSPSAATPNYLTLNHIKGNGPDTGTSTVQPDTGTRQENKDTDKKNQKTFNDESFRAGSGDETATEEQAPKTTKTKSKKTKRIEKVTVYKNRLSRPVKNASVTNDDDDTNSGGHVNQYTEDSYKDSNAKTRASQYPYNVSPVDQMANVQTPTNYAAVNTAGNTNLGQSSEEVRAAYANVNTPVYTQPQTPTVNSNAPIFQNQTGVTVSNNAVNTPSNVNTNENTNAPQVSGESTEGTSKGEDSESGMEASGSGPETVNSTTKSDSQVTQSENSQQSQPQPSPMSKQPVLSPKTAPEVPSLAPQEQSVNTTPSFQNQEYNAWNQSSNGANLSGYSQLQTLAMQANLAQMTPQLSVNRDYQQQQPKTPPVASERQDQVNFEQNVPSPSSSNFTPPAGPAESGKENVSQSPIEYDNSDRNNTNQNGNEEHIDQTDHPTHEVKQNETEKVPKVQSKIRKEKNKHLQQQTQNTQPVVSYKDNHEEQPFPEMGVSNKSTKLLAEPTIVNTESEMARQPPSQATKTVVNLESTDRPQEVTGLKTKQQPETQQQSQLQSQSQSQETEAVTQSANTKEPNLEEHKNRQLKENQLAEIQFAGTKPHKTSSEPIAIDQVKNMGEMPKLNPKDATISKTVRVHSKTEPELGEEVVNDKQPKAAGIETAPEINKPSPNPASSVEQEIEEDGSGNESKYGSLESVRAKFKAWEKQMIDKLSKSVLKGSQMLTPKETFDEVTAQVNKTAFQSWKEEEKNLLSHLGFPLYDLQNQKELTQQIDRQLPIKVSSPSIPVRQKNISLPINKDSEKEQHMPSVTPNITANSSTEIQRKPESKKSESKKSTANKNETGKIVLETEDQTKLAQLEKFKQQILGEVNKINNLQDQYKKVYHKSPELDKAKTVLEKDLKAIKDIEKKVSFDLQATEKKTSTSKKHKATNKEMKESKVNEGKVTPTVESNVNNQVPIKQVSDSNIQKVDNTLKVEDHIHEMAGIKGQIQDLRNVQKPHETASEVGLNTGSSTAQDDRVKQFIKMIDMNQKRSRDKHPLERIQGLLQAEIERVKETEKTKKKGKDPQLEYIRKLLKNELMHLLESGQYKKGTKSMDPNLKKLQKLIHNRVKKAKKNKRKSGQKKKKHKSQKVHKAGSIIGESTKQFDAKGGDLSKEGKPVIPNQAVLTQHISNALQGNDSQLQNTQNSQLTPQQLSNLAETGSPNISAPTPPPSPAPSPAPAAPPPPPPSPPPAPAAPPPPAAANAPNPGSALTNSEKAPDKYLPGAVPPGQLETATQTERFKSLLENLRKNIGEVYNRLQSQNRLPQDQNQNGVIVVNPNEPNNNQNANAGNTYDQNNNNPPNPSQQALNMPSTPPEPSPAPPPAAMVQPIAPPQPAEQEHYTAQSKHEMPPPADLEDEEKEEPELDTVLSESEPVQTLIENLEKDITDVWSYRDLYPDANSIGLDNEKIHRTYANLGSLSGLNLRRALDRALRGKDVGLAVVGGSISKGGPFSEKGVEFVLRAYFYAIADWWNKIIRPVTGSSMIVRDVSIGGIATDYFSYCLRTHLPNDKLTNIVLWELSANDMRRFEDGIKPKSQALEQFTRNVLSYKAKPALIYVNFFALFEWDEDLFTHCRNFEDEGENDVAKYYKITSLSWRNMVCPLLKEKAPLFTRDELFAEDHFHPSIEGHAQMAYILTDYIRTEFLKNLVKMRLLTIGQAVRRLTIPKTVYVPRPMFAETFQWRPLCYTYMLVDNRSPNNSLPLETENTSDFRYKIIRQFKIRSDKIAGMETSKRDQYITYKLRIPVHHRGDKTTYKRLAIMSFTDDRQAEVRYDRSVVRTVDTGKRFLEGTVLKYVAENISPGEHELTVRSNTGGFLICAIMAG